MYLISLDLWLIFLLSSRQAGLRGIRPSIVVQCFFPVVFAVSYDKKTNCFKKIFCQVTKGLGGVPNLHNWRGHQRHSLPGVLFILGPALTTHTHIIITGVSVVYTNTTSKCFWIFTSWVPLYPGPYLHGIHSMGSWFRANFWQCSATLPHHNHHRLHAGKLHSPAVSPAF